MIFHHIFFKNALALLVLFPFHRSSVSLCLSTKIPAESFLGSVLNLYITLGGIDLFIMLSLPIHEHGMYLHLFRSFFILSLAFCSFQHSGQVYVLLDLYLRSLFWRKFF